MATYSPINHSKLYSNEQYQYQPVNPQLSRSLDHSYVQSYHNNNINSPPNNKKQPFPSENLNLLDSPSFARNFKSRLFNVDPKEQEAKFRVQDKYRQQLKMQIEEDRRRKEAIKMKDQLEDQKLQRKFYENMKIQAQKKGNTKQQPNFFLMRTNKGKFSKENLTESRNGKRGIKLNNYLTDESLQKSNEKELQSKEKLKRTFYEPPQIIKRGGYHNKSSLDQMVRNPQQQADKYPRNEQKLRRSLHKQAIQDMVMSELDLQQNRMKQLLLFQDNMLRKLDYFKKEILNTSKALHLDKELEKVKLKLRSKPLNMNKINNLNSKDGIENVIDNDSFYHLPMINKNQKVYQGDREMKKKRDKDRHREPKESVYADNQEKQVINLTDQKIQEQNIQELTPGANVYNDKNIAAEYNLSENVVQGNNNDNS